MGGEDEETCVVSTEGSNKDDDGDGGSGSGGGCDVESGGGDCNGKGVERVVIVWSGVDGRCSRRTSKVRTRRRPFSMSDTQCSTSW